MVNKGVQKVKKLIYGLEAVMSEHGISTISEIYDGDSSSLTSGCYLTGMSVGEVLRIINLLETKFANQLTRIGYAGVNVRMGVYPISRVGLGTASYGLTKGYGNARLIVEVIFVVPKAWGR